MSLVPPGQQSPYPVATTNNNGVAVPPVSNLRDTFEMSPQVNAQPTQSFDFWGFLQRRKYLIALFSIIGCFLGYLNYTKSPKLYSSSTRLLVLTQAPPSIVNGNVLLNQKSSLPNHSSLLVSEMILGNAVSEGGLDRLDTFATTGNPVGALKSMIRVVPEKGDTLRISCSGPESTELPGILNQVVESYRREIVEDSQAVNEQTVELIEKLAGKLSDEKEDLEVDRLKLWKELDISSINEVGGVTNPFTRKLAELRSHKDDLELNIADIRLRIDQLVKSVSASEKAESKPDPLEFRIAAMEAREYLNAQTASEEGSASANPQVIQQRQSLQQRVWDIEGQISDLQSQLWERKQVVGAGHGDVITLKKQVKYWQGKAAKIRTQMAELELSTEEKQAMSSESVKLRESENRDMIRMYYIALDKKKEGLQTKIEGLEKRIETVSGQAAAVGEKIVKLNVIQKTIEKKEQAVDVILDRLKEMNVVADNYTMTKIRVLDEPKNGSQIAPSFTKCLATATMLAALLGMGLAFLIDQSELSFRSPAEILSHLQLPVVGKVPRIRTKGLNPAKGNAELIAAHRPASSEAESFRDVRTSLFFRANNEDIKTLLFTSPSPGDGKSTTAANMAISIAQAGKRVVLVDADFRRPRVNRYFGEDLDNGLLDVMSGEIELEEAIKATELQSGLSLITAGGHPKNPGELVTSEAFRKAIEKLREQFDYVLIDSPPVLAVSDSVTIASLVDGVYLVSRIRKGVKLTARKAKDSLDNVHARWMGLIVNDVDQNPYYNEYGYQYGSYAYYGSSSYRTYYETDKVPVNNRSRISSTVNS